MPSKSTDGEVDAAWSRGLPIIAPTSSPGGEPAFAVLSSGYEGSQRLASQFIVALSTSRFGSPRVTLVKGHRPIQPMLSEAELKVIAKEGNFILAKTIEC